AIDQLADRIFFTVPSLLLLGHAGLAEIFLGRDVGGELGPKFGDLNIVALEDDGAVRLLDDRRPLGPLDLTKNRLPRPRKIGTKDDPSLLEIFTNFLFFQWNYWRHVFPPPPVINR